MMAACYKSGNNDDESDNNEDKVCLLLKIWNLVGQVFDHALDYMLNHILGSYVRSYNHRSHDHSIIIWLYSYYPNDHAGINANWNWQLS